MSTKTDYSIYEIQKSPIVMSYRIIILLLGLGDIVYANITSLLSGTLFHPLIYFTYQSNALVLIWLFLALLWRNQPEKLEKICGPIRGAITVYISVTFIVYGIVLAPLANPTGIDIYLNLIHHYITPFVFIVDFFITERKQYRWIYTLPWLVYPHLYLIFSFVFGSITGVNIYFFLDFPSLGFAKYLMWYGILFTLILVLTAIYITYNIYFASRKFSVSLGKYSDEDEAVVHKS